MTGEQSADGTAKTAITGRVLNAVAFCLTNQHMAMRLPPAERFSYQLETTPYLILGLLQIVVVGEPSPSIVEALGRKGD